MVINTLKRYEKYIILILFIFSLPNSIGLLIFCIGLLILLADHITGAIKALLLLTIRSIVSPALGVSIGQFGILKWILIFGFSIYIIIFTKIKNKKDEKKLYTFTTLIVIFSLYCCLTSLITGSYPIVSIFKIISYSFVFYSVVLGVANTYQEVNWIKIFYQYFLPLILLSIIVIPFPQFKTVNNSFQGVLNHPNMMGIMISIFVAALIIVIFQNNNLSLKNIFLLIICFTMNFLSNARTGTFITFIIILYFIFLSKLISSHYKIIFITSVILIICILIIFSNILETVFNFLIDFVYKGNHDNILYSREKQIDNELKKIEENFWFGTGFAVPYIPGHQSFLFSFDLLVEPGNLLLMLLGDCGIIGLLIFVCLYGYIYFVGNKKYILLFIVPFMVSMSEMVFFSTNNMAIILYLFFSVYMFERSEEYK